MSWNEHCQVSNTVYLGSILDEGDERSQASMMVEMEGLEKEQNPSIRESKLRTEKENK